MKLLLLPLLVTTMALASDVPSEPVGFYSNGSLRNGVELPVAGPGYIRLFVHRNRGWGSQEMIDLIVNTSAGMNQKYPNMDRLQVGDISQQGGGPVTDLHSSHQNGLDVDLTFYRKNKVEQLQSQINGFQENMVVRGRLSKNFDTERNWEFMKQIHAQGQVQRVFVDPVIKKELCRFARQKNELYRHDEVLRSIRPLGNHHDHMHVRLKCPKSAADCVAQEEPPVGTGC